MIPISFFVKKAIFKLNFLFQFTATFDNKSQADDY